MMKDSCAIDCFNSSEVVRNDSVCQNILSLTSRKRFMKKHSLITLYHIIRRWRCCRSINFSFWGIWWRSTKEISWSKWMKLKLIRRWEKKECQLKVMLKWWLKLLLSNSPCIEWILLSKFWTRLWIKRKEKSKFLSKVWSVKSTRN